MKSEIKGKEIVKNVYLSLFAQIVSLFVSFILSIVVPKFIDEYQYAYWHTFLLYVSYVGVLHFGLLDGIILRYSQYNYEELDKRKVRSQFVALLCINLVAWLVLILIGIIKGDITQTIAFLVAFGILTKNIFTYNSYLFQITNRINKYAIVVIVQRLVYGIVVLLLIVFNQRNFVWYCLADLLGDCAGIAFSLISNKDLHFGELPPVKEVVKETWFNVSSGILLMFSNWSSMLLVSGAKMIIEWNWGILVFGKISFSFSAAHLFITFVSAISVVIFPSLKRMKQESLPAFYKKVRCMIMPFLFWSLLFYYPECWILEKWLPNYSSSLFYLGLLSPIVVYMTIVSLLTNNYFKALRKEKLLLFINAMAAFLAVCIYGISAYLMDDFKFMLLSIVLVIILRSIVSEFFVMNLINIKIEKEFFIEFGMTFAFLITVQYFNKINGFIVYLGCLTVYSYFNMNNIKMIAGQVMRVVKRKTG